MGLVRDPQFWKRFSTAIHMADEEKDLETGTQRTGTSRTVDSKDEWLEQQHRAKRRCRVIGWSVTFLVAILIAAGVVVALYFEGRIKF